MKLDEQNYVHLLRTIYNYNKFIKGGAPHVSVLEFFQYIKAPEADPEAINLAFEKCMDQFTQRMSEAFLANNEKDAITTAVDLKVGAGNVKINGVQTAVVIVWIVAGFARFKVPYQFIAKVDELGRVTEVAIPTKVSYEPGSIKEPI